ncbi:putative Condensin-2 complex subunit G2 [Nannochloris sp. 'desiccata']|nr:putative Condensin-2 complex subunit G2 [Chlorella desiccata (nom. nud.)]
MKKQLSEFLAGLYAEDPTSFIDAVESHISRRQGCDLEELFQSIPRRDMLLICEGLHQKVELGIALFNTDPQQEAAAMEEMQKDPKEEDPVILKEAGCEILIASAIVARLILVETMPSPPEALQNTAALLHDHALLPASEYPALQEEISKLCLEWWQLEGPERGRLTPALVPYLLVAALQSGTGAAVKRCHTIRNALELFDFDDPSIHDLKRLLLRAAFAPSFLRSTDGRRFLAYLFTLQPTFVGELTAIVKNQVPAGRRSVLDAYGEIIYRAWSSATGSCLLEIKEGCIQDLMKASILASAPALSASLRRVLGGLHSQKHQPGVDAMLLELYEPILFRRLNAANPAVRRNALELFFDTFPLRDPEESSEATDARMADQFAALSAALKDDVPVVRAAAVAGVGRILGAYWELIPGPVTAGYVKTLAGQLAFDSTSPVVRAAVTEALTDLIECPMAHPLLAVVLPKLAPQLYDASSRVRIAFVEMLLSLRGVKSLQWSAIVTSTKLLEVMGADIPAVSSRIHHLILPIYFPDSKMGPSLMAALLRSHPGAGKAFCLYLVGAHMPAAGGVKAAATTSAGPSIPQHYLVTLVKDLTTHLIEVPLATEAEKEAATAAAASGKGAAAKKGRTKRKKGQHKDDEEEDVPVIETSASWESILGGLVAISCGISAQILKGGLDPAAAKGLFPGDTFARVLKRCTTSSARAAVYNIAAALPQTPAASDVRTACVTLLGSDNNGNESGEGQVDAEEIHAALDCVAAHPASRYALLKAMAQPFNANPEELCEGIETQVEEPPQRGKRRKFEKHAMKEISQAAVLDHLTGLLELKGPRDFFLTSGVLGRILPWITTTLETRVAELSSAIDKNNPAEELAGRPDAGTAMLTYLKACVHLLLASQPGLDGPALLDGSAGDAARVQAVECLQQAMQWSTRLLQRLDTIEIEGLAVALNPPAPADPPPQPAKRTKAASKSKKAAAAAVVPNALPATASALKEAYSTIQASVAVAGEGARFKSLVCIGSRDVSSVTSWAPEAAQTGLLFIQIVGKLAASARDAPIDADMQMVQAVVLSGVSHCARLARNLAASCIRPSVNPGGSDPESARDIGTELANAARNGDEEAFVSAAVGASGGDFVGPLAKALMTVLCEDAYGSIITPLKSHVVGLMAAMCTTTARNNASSNSAAVVGADGSWLAPAAALLASGIDFDDLLASQQDKTQIEAEKEEENEDDENLRPSSDGGKTTKLAAPAKKTLPELLSEETKAPVIKQLLAATRMFKANESAAGQAAALAAHAWLSQEDAALALGGIELSQLLGFQGVTLLGKSKAGVKTYTTAIRKLREIQKSFLVNPTSAGDGAAAVPAENVLLERKIKALFPPAPQMIFDEIFAP